MLPVRKVHRRLQWLLLLVALTENISHLLEEKNNWSRLTHFDIPCMKVMCIVCQPQYLMQFKGYEANANRIVCRSDGGRGGDDGVVVLSRSPLCKSAEFINLLDKLNYELWTENRCIKGAARNPYR